MKQILSKKALWMLYQQASSMSGSQDQSSLSISECSLKLATVLQGILSSVQSSTDF